jgi:hypothetical protein
MSVCQTVCTQVSARFPRGGSTWKLTGGFHENLLKIQNWMGHKMGFTWRSKYVSLYLATLNRHKTVTYEWNCIRLSGWPGRHKHYANVSHFYIVCLFVSEGKQRSLFAPLMFTKWAAIYSSFLSKGDCKLNLLFTYHSWWPIQNIRHCIMFGYHIWYKQIIATQPYDCDTVGHVLFYGENCCVE